MTQSFLYDGNPLLRVRTGEVELTESAELGAVGNGRIMVNDTAGTLAIVGQKDLAVDQDDCANPVLFRGFVGDQTYERGKEAQGPSREISIVTEDLNSMLAFLVFSGDSAAEGNRPAETVDQRLTWLATWLGTHMPGLFVGTRIGSSSNGMEATQYRDQHPTDVLAGVVLAAESWNYYVRDFGTGDGPELVCRNDNTSTDDTAGFAISNVLTEVDHDTVFPPFKDFALSKRPGRVGSKVRFSYAKDTVTEERAATATAFNGERDLTASDASILSPSVAHARARSLLWQHHTEERVIEGTILVPPEKVNLACQGDRIGVRLEHMTPEGFYDPDALVYCRILERTPKPKLKPSRLYEVHMRLSPQEAGPVAAGFVQRAFARADTSEATPTFANLLTVGNKLLVAVYKTGQALPAAPLTSGPVDFWGAGAWTRLNGSARTAIDSYYSAPTPAEVYDGLAFYYKTIDATTQAGSTPDNTVGAWELPATANLAGATLVTKDAQTTAADPCVFDAGSLGTVAVGDLAIYVVIWENNVNAGGSPTGYSGDFLPLTPVAPGDFTERWYHGQTSTSYGPYPAEYPAQVWIGDLVGTGGSVSASIEKPRNERNGFDFGVVGWAAIGIKVSV